MSVTAKNEAETVDSFETVVTPKRNLFDFKLGELWKYRDLIGLFVKRTFVAQYKQTVLGPAWAVIQPFFTTVVFTIFFGNMAGLAPSGIPSFPYYLCGSVAWSYFAGSFQATSTTFTSNSAILGKVYFPRLIMPVTTVLSQLISFVIQFVFFGAFLVYYVATGANVHPNAYMLMLPLLVLQMAALGLGFGVIISSLTTKYRDLTHLIGFGVSLWMYSTPVAYDVTNIPQKYMTLYMMNPLTPIINTFKYAFLGVGSFELNYYLISWAVTLVVLFVGIILFNRVEKTFMDTI